MSLSDSHLIDLRNLSHDNLYCFFNFAEIDAEFLWLNWSGIKWNRNEIAYFKWIGLRFVYIFLGWECNCLTEKMGFKQINYDSHLYFNFQFYLYQIDCFQYSKLYTYFSTNWSFHFPCSHLNLHSLFTNSFSMHQIYF